MNWRTRLRDGLQDLEPYRVTRPRGVIHLDANESPWALDPAAQSHLIESLEVLSLNRYPEASAAGFREAVARRNGVHADQVVPGNGSDEVLGMLLTAFAAPRGDAPPACAYPTPTFSMYDIHARCVGTATIEIPTGEDFQLDPGRVHDVLQKEHPNLLFLARPNNPTGTQWSREVVDAAAAVEDVIVVIDEAYGPFAEETALDLIEDHPNVVVMRSLSKVGLAALRVGYAIAHPELAHELDKVRLPYNVNTISQAMATYVIDHWDGIIAPGVQKVIAERRHLAAELFSRGVKVFDSGANLLLVRVDDPTERFEGLKEQGVLVRHLHKPGTALEGCLRITVGTPDENAALLAAWDSLA